MNVRFGKLKAAGDIFKHSDGMKPGCQVFTRGEIGRRQ